MPSGQSNHPTPPSPLPRWWDRIQWVAALGCLAAAWLVYHPTLDHQFVWDDHALIQRDPLIRSWHQLPEAFRHFLFLDATASNFYRPIQRVTYLVDYACWGLNPRGYHLTNLLLHAAVGWALVFFIRTLAALHGLSARTSAVTSIGMALLWLVHPLHHSAVAYAAGRADLLAAGFLFAALAVGLQASARREGIGWGKWSVATLLLTCAVLSKEAALAGLLLFPLLIGWQNRRMLLPAVGLMLVVLLVVAGLRSQASRLPVPPPRTPAAWQWDAAGRALAEYGGLLVWPQTLRMERSTLLEPEAGDAERMRHGALTITGVALALGLSWLIVSGIRRRRPWAPPATAALVVYVPISGLFPLNATMAEHWLYLPTGFAAAAVALALGARRWSRNAVLIALAIGIGTGVAWGWRTWRVLPLWENDRSFFEGTIAAGGRTARMLMSLGLLELRERNFEAAREYLDEALAHDPTLGFALVNRGNLAYAMGDPEEAMRWYALAWREPFVRISVLQNIGALEWQTMGRDQTGRLLQAARMAPDNWAIHRRLVLWLRHRGAHTAALNELAAFLRRSPFRAESWQLLAALLEDQGRYEQAAAAHQEARRLDMHMESAGSTERPAQGTE